MIPTEPGFDPVQAAYNLTRKNPAIDWQIEMLQHLKQGDFEQAKRCGLKAAEINIELADAPEVDAAGATDHLISAAAILEQIQEYARAAQVYGKAVARDPSPGTRIIEGRRRTSPLRHFDLLAKAGDASGSRNVLEEASTRAHERFDAAWAAKDWPNAQQDALYLAEIFGRLADEPSVRGWLARSVESGVRAGEFLRVSTDVRQSDPYGLSRAAFNEAFSACLRLKDDALFIDTFRKLEAAEARAARAVSGASERWAAFKPMEWLIEAGVHATVLGEFDEARSLFELARPLVENHWKEQRGPTLYRMYGHLAILSGKREEAEALRRAYHEEFRRKERFDPEVAKPILLEFDEEFYRMLGDEENYHRTMIEIVHNLEPGMREVFSGVDAFLERGLWEEAKKPLDELGPESKDQRIWRLLYAYVNWRLRVKKGEAREGDPRAFEDHMWHATHAVNTARLGYNWSAILEALGAEEDPIDLHPLQRTLDFIHGRKKGAT